MPYSPSPRQESLAQALLPPACAEHVLGDLAESSRSDGEYFHHLASILPRVIWSQIRRRVTMAGLIFHSVLTALIFAVAQGNPNGPSFFAEPWAVVRLAIPGAMWVLGCALAAAQHGPRDNPAQSNRLIFVATIVLSVASAALLGVPLTRFIIGLAIVFGTLLVLSWPTLTRKQLPPLSLDSLPDYARRFQKMIWWRNARESAACAAVLLFNIKDVWTSADLMTRTSHLLLIAGVAFVMVYIHTRANSRNVPGDADTGTMLRFHQHEIARQRDILRAVPYWYLLPFVPGMAAMIVAKGQINGARTIIGATVLITLFGVVWLLNIGGSKWLQRELNKVDALEANL